MSVSSPDHKRRKRNDHEDDNSPKRPKKHKHKSKHHKGHRHDEKEQHRRKTDSKERRSRSSRKDNEGSPDDSGERSQKSAHKDRLADDSRKQYRSSEEKGSSRSHITENEDKSSYERKAEESRHYKNYRDDDRRDARDYKDHRRIDDRDYKGHSHRDDRDYKDIYRRDDRDYKGHSHRDDRDYKGHSHRDDRDYRDLHHRDDKDLHRRYDRDTPSSDSKHHSSGNMREQDSSSTSRQSIHVKLDGEKRADDRDKQPEYDFDFSKYRNSLNRIFFREQDILPRGSKLYEDFWAFLQKYQAFQKKKAESGQSKGSTNSPSEEAGSSSTTALDIPQNYDRRHRINFRLLSRDADDFIKHGRLVDYEVDKELTRERVQQFRDVLLHYLDFCQKEKFKKLCKIRSDQKNLPIYQYKDKIVATLRENQIVVVAGDTGCGKSTQVPQYLLEAGFDKIVCTQPRRIACVSLAKRVGFETLNEYGSQVAFQVRFEKTKTSSTKILFLTEGLLLRQLTTDQLLSQYSVIVIDEVHERHIYTDFLLGVLKCLLKMRKDLKLVLMSATINISLFSQYFDNAPVVKVPGRLYPIEMEYCPFNRNTELYNSGRPTKLDPTPYIRILQRIDSLYPPTERGDLLIFLSGLTEIMTVVEAAKLYTQQVKRWIILPLHSSLSVEDQEKVFDYPPDGIRKCIVSTNIAETSVTIDGVRFVVDSGKVKEMSFDPKYKMQKLKEFWISRASAEQRKGRAGRTGPGVCFRLYAESDYDEFEAYNTPEILRVPLDSLVLQLISMGLPNVRKFPFIEPPDMSSIENSVRFLKEQGALAADETLTPIGQMLSMLPVDVVIGKMLIMGSIFHMIDPVLSIAAAMSVQSPFTGKAHVDHDAIAARKSLESDHGDPLTLLNAFDEWIQVKAEGRGTQKWCKRRCLEEQRFYEMTKLKRQFKELLKDHHLLDEGSSGGDRRQLFTSEQRRQHHGEKKRLNQLKRDQLNERKRRKVLKVEDEEFPVSDKEEDDKGADIKDLEFRLTHNLNQLQEHSNRSRSFTLRDVNLLKIILCSGIFPQVALADDCNSFKGNSEQAFHTKNKPFILLHPTCVFGYRPDLLKPPEAPEKHAGPSDLKGRLGTKHELLAYGSLLETNNKPYLVNCLRVPAIQTLTLFTNSIDTNADCTRLVCDDWLEVRFPDAECAEQVLSSVITLRSTWLNLLQLRLEDTFESMDEDREASPRARQLEHLLSTKLAEYLDSRVPYALRKVLAAEMQHLYVGPGHKGTASAGMKMFMKGSGEAQEHPVKGGIQVNSYLTYNCLLDEASASMWGQYTSHMQRHWTCPHCQESMIVSVVERLQHEASCQPEEASATAGSSEAAGGSDDGADNPLKMGYHCSVCDKTLRLTATEMLKHKKSHAESSNV